MAVNRVAKSGPVQEMYVPVSEFQKSLAKNPGTVISPEDKKLVDNASLDQLVWVRFAFDILEKKSGKKRSKFGAIVVKSVVPFDENLINAQLEFAPVPGADTVGKNSVGKEFPNLSVELPKLEEYRKDQLFQAMQMLTGIRDATEQVRIDFARPEDQALVKNGNPWTGILILGTFENPDGTPRPPLYFKLVVCYDPKQEKRKNYDLWHQAMREYPEVPIIYVP